MFKAAAEELDGEAWEAARPEDPDNPDNPELANALECRAENPATCPTHGTPAKTSPKSSTADKADAPGNPDDFGASAEATKTEKPENPELANSTDANGNEHAAKGSANGGQFVSKGEGASGRNDGKIDFRGNTRAKAKADTQATRLGYAGIDDLMQQSASVTAERIAEIMAGADSPCKAHEAIAALRSHATITPNASGEEPVRLTERPIRHYVCGERRHHGGEPDIARLRSLPLAIKAIRECDSFHHELDERRIAMMPGEKPPKGTQTIYERRSGPGKSKAFAYTDSGVLNGWQLN